ncbi:hypothetical protein V7S43_010720 [Phytophthora oleae]|uniref:Uncharacterized protein n=1 Tax=Phytophthora oleae TaxID=2107226 RepID=A0ABD3FBX4_9STRA
MTNRQKKPCQDVISRLVDDLRAKKVLCRVKDYPGVKLEQLNDHVKKLSPLEKTFLARNQRSSSTKAASSPIERSTMAMR